jgi:hypothetical protein
MTPEMVKIPELSKIPELMILGQNQPLLEIYGHDSETWTDTD